MGALGRCWKVLIIMFTKGGNDYGELNSFRELSPDISNNFKNSSEQDWIGLFIRITNLKLIKKAILEGWELAKKL